MRQATTRSLALLIFAVGTSSASAQDCRDSLKSRAGIVIPPAIEAQLRSVATEFCGVQTQANRVPTMVVVTSGTRSTADEATELERRLQRGDHLAYYENQEAVKEIRAAFTSGKPLTEVLDRQVARGCYVSKHLFDRAVDIQNSGMDKASQEAFKMIATKAGALVIEDEGGVHTHFHLNFPPYPHNPKKCP